MAVVGLTTLSAAMNSSDDLFLCIAGEEGGYAGCSFTGRRMKLGLVEVFIGVSPIASITGDGLRLYSSLRAGRFPVEGTMAVTLDGGINSSKPSENFRPPSDLTGNMFLNRLFAGVALT